MQDNPFKVIIVGGSVAGLSLANMLQANNIDFVILEAHSTIAPQIGASIGLLPHGNRILDQLGVFDKIAALSRPVDSFTFRDSNATTIATCSGTTKTFMQRHGYPIIFLDRQMVLQVLYDNIKDKTKVLTSKRVQKIQIDGGSATAITTDKSSYRGDIVIGADGVHSSVRSEMWRLAHKFRPGWFDHAEEEAPPCDYNCIFGISKPCGGITSGHLYSVFREKSSYLINGGPGNRVYWFRFQKLPKTFYGSDVPRYTESDMEKTISDALDDDIFPDVKFETLVNNKISGSMTSLSEYIYKKWFFDRIFCVGDSAHKVHPIGGHGGNAAIETAATLTNHLVKALQNSPSKRLAVSEIERIYLSVQDIRRDRIVSIKDYSHDQQRTESLDSVFKKLQALFILPLVDEEDVTFNFSSNIPAGQKLSMIEVAKSDKLIPFDDELLSPPKKRGPYQWMLITFYLLCAALTYFLMWVRSESWGLTNQLVDIVMSGTFPYDPAFPLKRTYTGISTVDNYLVFLTAVFIPGIQGWDKRFGALQMYFLGHLVQPIAIWTAEAFRGRNALTPIAFPIIWFTLFQTTGIGVYMPIYYAVYTFVSENEVYWWPLKRRIRIQYSKTMLIASLLGYALPTLLMFLPWNDACRIQNFEVLWQFSPMFVPLLSSILGILYHCINPDMAESNQREIMSKFSRDVADLQILYAATGILGVCLHWGIMMRLLTSTDPGLSLGQVFAPNWSVGPQTLGEGIRNLWMADFWGFYVATYMWCVSAVWDIKRVGRTTVDLGYAALLIFVAHFIFGPGATHSAVWYWREGRMARCSFSKGKVN